MSNDISSLSKVITNTRSRLYILLWDITLSARLAQLVERQTGMQIYMQMRIISIQKDKFLFDCMFCLKCSTLQERKVILPVSHR